jgi:hypothetical protein
MSEPREIRAFYTDKTIRVYQAFNHAIADAAIQHQRFVSPPFKMERTTWIKPSFFWMMYRSGWATKENQERILGVDITHEGFLWALNNSCLSHPKMGVYQTKEDWKKAKDDAPVVIQWDPERDMYLMKMNYRTIQIGLSPEATSLYVNEWIVGIHDITDDAKKIRAAIQGGKLEEANSLIPIERRYEAIGDFQ